MFKQTRIRYQCYQCWRMFGRGVTTPSGIKSLRKRLDKLSKITGLSAPRILDRFQKAEGQPSKVAAEWLRLAAKQLKNEGVPV